MEKEGGMTFGEAVREREGRDPVEEGDGLDVE